MLESPLLSRQTQECDWTQEDRDKEQQLLNELVSVIDQRNLIISSLDRDVQRFAEAFRSVFSRRRKADYSSLSPGKRARTNFSRPR